MFKFYLKNNSDEWVRQVVEISPKIEKTLDDNLDNAILSFTTSNKTPITPYTESKLIINDTTTYYFYASSDSYLLGNGIYKHIVVLTDPIDKLSGYYLGNKSFTKPLYKAGKNIYEVLTILQEICPTEIASRLDDTRAFTIYSGIQSTLESISAVDLEITGDKTLLEAIQIISEYIHAKPIIINGFEELSFIFYEDLTKTAVADTNTIIGEKWVYDESQYQSTLVSNLDNVIIDNNSRASTITTFPQTLRAYNSTKVEISGDLVLPLENNIDYIEDILVTNFSAYNGSTLVKTYTYPEMVSLTKGSIYQTLDYTCITTEFDGYSVILDDNTHLSDVDDYYNGMKLYISNNDTTRTIINYDATTRKVTLDSYINLSAYSSISIWIYYITPYFLEKSLYDGLEDTLTKTPTGEYLYYDYQDNKIQNFTHRAKSLSSNIKDYTIRNILLKVAQYDDGEVSSIDSIDSDILDLIFVVKYKPQISVLTKRSKITDNNFRRELISNQQTSTTSSVRQGENMLEKSRRIGGLELYRTYKFDYGDTLVELNDRILVDSIEYTAYKISIEFSARSIKQTVCYSKYFAGENRFLGVDSNRRFTNYADSGSLIECKRNYTNYCIVSDEVLGFDFGLPNSLLNNFKDSDTSGRDTYTNPISYAQIATSNELYGGSIIQGLILTVASYGSSNSINLVCKVVDNYKAGDEVYDETASIPRQKGITYKDDNNEVKYLNCWFSRSISSTNILEQAYITPDIYIGGIVTTEILINDLVINLDNKEQLIFTYQLQFLTNNSDTIIGAFLSEKNVLVEGDDLSELNICLFDKKLSKFDNRTFSESDFTRIDRSLLKTEVTINDDPVDATLNVPIVNIKAVSDGTISEHQSWGIVDYYGNLYLAKNGQLDTTFEKGDILHTFYFNGRRDLQGISLQN